MEIFKRLFSLHLIAVQDDPNHKYFALQVLERHVERIEESFIKIYKQQQSTIEENQNKSEEQQKQQREKQQTKRKWYDSLLSNAFLMIQRFYFAVFVEGDEEAEAIKNTRDFYKRAHKRIQHQCGSEASVVAVLKLWRAFEEQYGNEDTKKTMHGAATAKQKQTSRLFARAQKI
jgi:hypothetical protein